MFEILKNLWRKQNKVEKPKMNKEYINTLRKSKPLNEETQRILFEKKLEEPEYQEISLEEYEKLNIIEPSRHELYRTTDRKRRAGDIANIISLKNGQVTNMLYKIVK